MLTVLSNHCSNITTKIILKYSVMKINLNVQTYRKRCNRGTRDPQKTKDMYNYKNCKRKFDEKNYTDKQTNTRTKRR